MCRPRIIPARAGFTNGIDPRFIESTDHPRSRGVYKSTWTGISGEEGSSPLARGLRARFRNHHTLTRIIPARAGFTLWTFGQRLLTADHPRSRGVYLYRTFIPLQ